MATPAKGKKPTKSKTAARATATRPTAKAATTRAKYEQAGAPWWKRIPLPQPKS